MTRISVSAETLLGRKVLAQTNQLISLSDQSRRLMAQLDAISNAGLNPELLESSPECKFPAGQGAFLYNELKKIRSLLNGLTDFNATIDQG